MTLVSPCCQVHAQRKKIIIIWFIFSYFTIKYKKKYLKIWLKQLKTGEFHFFFQIFLLLQILKIADAPHIWKTWKIEWMNNVLILLLHLLLFMVCIMYACLMSLPLGGAISCGHCMLEKLRFNFWLFQIMEQHH